MELYDKIIEETPNMKETKKVVVSLSGGLDSTILLYLMTARYGKDNVYALSYNYNQRHDIELIQAKKTTKRLGVAHKVIDISFMGDVAAGVSAMVKGSVATPTMEDVLGEPQPVTYMPNRNMMLASITAAFAESVGADSVALGIQKIDSYAYWDTTPEFYEAIGNVFKLNRKFPIKFIAPFITLSKVEEIHLAQELGVELGETWTCYNPTITPVDDTYNEEKINGYIVRVPVHHSHYATCGTCPSCFERAEAFKKVGIADPVVVNGVTA